MIMIVSYNSLVLSGLVWDGMSRSTTSTGTGIDCQGGMDDENSTLLLAIAPQARRNVH